MTHEAWLKELQTSVPYIPKISKKKRFNYFRYITLPTFLWRYSGWEFIDSLYSYYWLNIKHRKQLWEDADEQYCERRWCRYCGKGTIISKKIIKIKKKKK